MPCRPGLKVEEARASGTDARASLGAPQARRASASEPNQVALFVLRPDQCPVPVVSLPSKVGPGH